MKPPVHTCDEIVPPLRHDKIAWRGDRAIRFGIACLHLVIGPGKAGAVPRGRPHRCTSQVRDRRERVERFPSIKLFVVDVSAAPARSRDICN